MSFLCRITLFLFISIDIANSPLAIAQVRKSGFFSGGKYHTITIDQNLVAVPSGTNKKTPRVTAFARDEIAKFSELGLELRPRNATKPATPGVGFPFWFDRVKGAIGVLTTEIMVRTDSSNAKSLIQKTLGATTIVETRFKNGLYTVTYTSPIRALTAANALFHQAGIIYAHPNFMIPKDFREPPLKSEKFSPTTEPLYGQQWHLNNTGQTQGVTGADIKAEMAWTITQGNPAIKIAIIDGGFEINHEDLAGAWYLNPGEIAGDGLDNDHNGYIDDIHGWNFRAKSPDHRDALHPQHGTAVAGLAGARVNGLGVTGVCPNCTIIPITSSFSPEADAEAIYYAGNMKADVISNSWGYPIGTPNTDVVIEALQSVINSGREGKKTIVLFAMNNFDNDDCAGDRPDISSLPDVIAISAATDRDEKSSESGWGPCIKFISPTWMMQHKIWGIVSTDLSGEAGYNPKQFKNDLPNLNYTRGFSGTSAATPIAAGIFGLLLSVDSSLTKDQALELMKSGADKVSPKKANYDPNSGFSEHYGYGRVDAARTLLGAFIRKKRISLLQDNNIKSINQQ